MALLRSAATVAWYAIAILAPQLAGACACIPDPRPLAEQTKEALKAAQTVISVQVVASAPLEGGTLQRETLRVLRVWKGTVRRGDMISRDSVMDPDLCGAPSSTGQTMVLFLEGGLAIGPINCNDRQSKRFQLRQERLLDSLTISESRKRMAPNNAFERTVIHKVPGRLAGAIATRAPAACPLRFRAVAQRGR